MEKPLSNEIIQSIRVGVVGANTMQWNIGGSINIMGNKHTITEIIRDEVSFMYFGTITYLIYGEYKGEVKLLKVYENQPVSLSIQV